MKKEKKLYCTTCGNIDVPEKTNKGNYFFEFLLWIVPLGVFTDTSGLQTQESEALAIVIAFFAIRYSYLRRKNAVETCKACKSQHVVPLDSPKVKGAL
jgi:hypothetical protein